jgi:hypothetical protein
VPAVPPVVPAVPLVVPAVPPDVPALPVAPAVPPLVPAVPAPEPVPVEQPRLATIVIARSDAGSAQILKLMFRIFSPSVLRTIEDDIVVSCVSGAEPIRREMRNARSVVNLGF